MADVKLTKNELRAQQNRLRQLEKYLPTLQLKKALLQGEVNEARMELGGLTCERDQQQTYVEGYSALFTDLKLEPQLLAKVEKIEKQYDNIAGVDIPKFEGVRFFEPSYDLFVTPPWLEAAMDGVRELVICEVKIAIGREKCQALEKEFREVSIRVNLFEKILIPRALKNIKKIKVFLGDQQLAAVAQAKVAKRKIACV